MRHRWLSYENGRFSGELDGSRGLNFLKILQWKLLHRNPDKARKRRERFILPAVDHLERLASHDDFICWLGHASFLIQLGGKRVIIDPVFGDIPMVRRHNPAPYTPEELGAADMLLVSHTHYDHLDAPSIAALQVDEAVIPLHMSPYIAPLQPDAALYELEWYETYHNGLFITLVPAKHWGRRGPFDKNRALWGGFIISDGEKSIYFPGDSSYGPHFKEIGERFAIDYALLPIGAYRPAMIMRHNHMDPDEAYRAFKDLGAKRMVPMHYGTFDLSDEPLGEPLERMAALAERDDAVIMMRCGEVLPVGERLS